MNEALSVVDLLERGGLLAFMAVVIYVGVKVVAKLFNKMVEDQENVIRRLEKSLSDERAQHAKTAQRRDVLVDELRSSTSERDFYKALAERMERELREANSALRTIATD